MAENIPTPPYLMGNFSCLCACSAEVGREMLLLLGDDFIKDTAVAYVEIWGS